MNINLGNEDGHFKGIVSMVQVPVSVGHLGGARHFVLAQAKSDIILDIWQGIL
jgi:hypothetical protein